MLLLLLVTAPLEVSTDWRSYVRGKNECPLSCVDARSQMILAGPHGCRVQKRKLPKVALAPTAQARGATYSAEIDVMAGPETETSRLANVFPQEAQLRVWREQDGTRALLASTGGSARAVLGIAVSPDGHKIVIAFTYQKTMHEGKDQLDVDILGLDFACKR